MNYNYNESMKNIGRDCSTFRKNILKMTQDEMAAESGFSQSTISSFERGDSFSTRVLLWYIGRGYDASRLPSMMEEV